MITIGIQFREKKMLMKSQIKIVHRNSSLIPNPKKMIKEENIIIKVLFFILIFKMVYILIRIVLH